MPARAADAGLRPPARSAPRKQCLAGAVASPFLPAALSASLPAALSAFLSVSLVLTPGAVTAQPGLDAYGNPVPYRAAAPFDEFAGMTRINQAAAVMLRETGIVSPQVAGRLARGIVAVTERNAAPGAERPRDYLKYEPQLIAAAGPDGSLLHLGRSRQDMGSTLTRLQLREGLLAAIEALGDARDRTLALAERYPDTLIPAYTHGVQAQPTTVGHAMHAFAAALGRDATRLRAAYEGLNRSPLGAAVIANSGYPVDRLRLATLLGFDGVVENAYDANHRSPVDSGLELASALAISAIAIGQFAQDLTAQYADPAPWFLLTDGKLTGGSSIMPQKRNPVALTNLRHAASGIVGAMNTSFLIAHNTPTGMYDYRRPDAVPVAGAAALYRLLADVVGGLVVDAPRALAEIDAEYSTMTEVADFLMLKAGVPFRNGHHFAAELAKFGRSRKLAPGDIPYADAQRLYRQDTGQDLPLTEADYRQALSAAYMVQSRRGIGGTQPDEVRRMIASARRTLADDRAWTQARRQRLADAQAALDAAFQALTRTAP
jgi:argininosuccinate lyase